MPEEKKPEEKKPAILERITDPFRPHEPKPVIRAHEEKPVQKPPAVAVKTESRERTVKIESVEQVPSGEGHLLVRGKVGSKHVSARFHPHAFAHMPEKEHRQEYVARQLAAVADQQEAEPGETPEGFDLAGTVTLKD